MLNIARDLQKLHRFFSRDGPGKPRRFHHVGGIRMMIIPDIKLDVQND